MPGLQRAMPDFRLPRPDQRVAIIGHTGSGKTIGALWVLSMADFHKRPYVIIDFKAEKFFDQIPRLEQLKPTAQVPRRPGLYRMIPRPDEQDLVDQFLWRVWERGKCGLYVDEGLMLDKYGSGLQACLTQGRARGIPMIVICQRPVFTTPFVFTQADHFMVFKLIGLKDYDTLKGYVGENVKTEFDTLPQYHSLWYDVARDAKFRLAPVPQIDYLKESFDRRLPLGFWGDLPRSRS